jgi:hypothetical protein
VKKETSLKREALLATWSMLGILFDPEDGDDMFLRNAGLISTDYMAPYPRT